MTRSLTTPPAAPVCAVSPKLQRHSGIGAWLLHALAVYRSRQRLLQVDDRMLDDIGLNADAARAEARRPIWDVPSRWIR